MVLILHRTTHTRDFTHVNNLISTKDTGHTTGLQYKTLAKVKGCNPSFLLPVGFRHQNTNSFKQLFNHTKLKKQVLLNSILVDFFLKQIITNYLKVPLN